MKEEVWQVCQLFLRIKMTHEVCQKEMSIYLRKNQSDNIFPLLFANPMGLTLLHFLQLFREKIVVSEFIFYIYLVVF